LKFASLDGDPAVWSPDVAFVFRDGAWREVNSAEVGMNGRVLSEAEFVSRFGERPLLPPLTTCQSFNNSTWAKRVSKGDLE
jgi:hypothetical protein